MAKSGIKHTHIGVEGTQEEWVDESTHTINRGTSFPASPDERQLFYRTDLQALYIYTIDWFKLSGESITDTEILAILGV